MLCMAIRSGTSPSRLRLRRRERDGIPGIASVLQPVDNIGKLVAHRILAKIRNGGGEGADIPQKTRIDPTPEPGGNVDSCKVKR